MEREGERKRETRNFFHEFITSECVIYASRLWNKREIYPSEAKANPEKTGLKFHK